MGQDFLKFGEITTFPGEGKRALRMRALCQAKAIRDRTKAASGNVTRIHSSVFME